MILEFFITYWREILALVFFTLWLLSLRARAVAANDARHWKARSAEWETSCDGWKTDWEDLRQILMKREGGGE